MTLRAVAIAIALTVAVLATLGFIFGHVGGALVVALYALIIFVLFALERATYRPRVDASRGEWQTTGERFVDPASGDVLDVWFDPTTGQRDYRSRRES